VIGVAPDKFNLFRRAGVVKNSGHLGGQFMAARVVPVAWGELPALHGSSVLFARRLGW